MHNYVPVKENLMERHIKTQGTCPDCGVQDEIVYHVLIIVLLLPCFGGLSMKCLILNCPDCILLRGALIYWIIHFALLQTAAPFYVECGQFGQCTMEDAMGKQK